MKNRLAVAALLALTLGAAVARAERPRIAIIEIGGTKVSPDLRERMTRAVHEGLLASGADVVDGMPAAATGPGGAPCQGNGCVTAVAKATLSAFVARGTLEVDGRTYELRLEMLDGKTGDLVESREDRCEICTEGEALEMAGVSASALKVQTFKKRSALAQGLGETSGTAVAVVPAPVKPVMVAAPPGSGVAEGGPHAGPSGVRGESRRELGWIGVGVGLFAGLVGGRLIAIDGDGTCTADAGVQCPHVYSTTGWGVASIVGGALALTAGVLVLSGKF